MRLFAVRVDIFEPQNAFPIVQHQFLGRSREEAEGYHDAHRASDRFLRQCEDKQLFDGKVKCRAVIRRGWVRWKGA